MDTVIVDGLFVGAPYETEVWCSKIVADALDQLQQGTKRERQIANKVDYYARAGFRNHEGGHGPIRSEGNGVFRIGAWGDLFRILGFYSTERKDEFIAIDAFGKREQKLRKNEKLLIERVAHIKSDKLWEKA